MVWRIEITPRARKALRKVKDRRLRLRLIQAVDGLMEEPRPAGCIKLSGHDALWRIRVGDWRIVYRIDDGRLVIFVVDAGPRGGIYEQVER